MIKSRLLVVSLLAITTFAACKKKEGDSAASGSAATGSAATATGDKPADPVATKPAEPPADKPAGAAPSFKLVETPLDAFGPAFKGYVAMLPEGAKLEYDDPSRQVHLTDTDYVSISSAPYWEDGVASLSKDADNKNIKKVSATEVTYERTPPLGTAWAVDVLVKVGKDKFSCTAGEPGTFSSAAMRDAIADMCKSIKKK